MDAIVTTDLIKTYRIGIGRARVREMLPSPIDRGVARLFPKWWQRDTFNALDGISLSVAPGSSIGIVGHNGAGKTTLLKVLADVTAPTRGRVAVSGHVAALIDAIVGFHPELTGRENAYLLGAMLGYGRQAMAERIDRVLEFADINDLADTPLKRYSAGMVSRIGFATVSSLDVDVLLIDEVLAVGDAAFQRKCIGWLEQYRAGGGTLLFVSHNLALVRNMTDRVVWIDHGKVVQDGPTSEVLAEYGRALGQRDFGEARSGRKALRRMMMSRGQHRYGAGGVRVEEVKVEESGSGPESLHVAIQYGPVDVDQAIFCVGFIDEGGREVASSASELVTLKTAGGSIACAFRPLPLRTGIYFPFVAILSPSGLVLDRWRLDRAVAVDRNGEILMPDEFGSVQIEASWSNGTAGGS
jgi:ABC-type polysaccharide/polyol phosphate transport system ATPase subunit